MSATRTFVSVEVAFDGIHNWEGAPHFLRHPHQHRFRVRLKVETIPGDNTRSLEYFELKRVLRKAIDSAFPQMDSLGIRLLGGSSTERAADLTYQCLPSDIRGRRVWIAVAEDETQGSESEYEPESSSTPYDDALPISENRLRARVEELGAEISRDYQAERSLTVVCLLKGALVFVADLIRRIDHSDLTVEFLRVRSYRGTERGELEIVDPVPDVSGAHVLLVDDICDSGATLNRARQQLGEAGAASIRTVALLRRSNSTTRLDYCGFELNGDDFVVGYGLDLDEKQRGLPFVKKAA